MILSAHQAQTLKQPLFNNSNNNNNNNNKIATTATMIIIYSLKALGKSRSSGKVAHYTFCKKNNTEK